MKLMKMVAGILLLVAIFGVRVSAQELSLYGPLPISPAPVSPPPENMLFGIPKPHLSKPHVDKPTRANFELGGGYMYRSLLQADGKRLNMNGFSMYLDYRIFRWLSVASDLSGAYNINSTNGNTQLYTLMFGARIYPLGHRHRITPFGEFLIRTGLFRLQPGKPRRLQSLQSLGMVYCLDGRRRHQCEIQNPLDDSPDRIRLRAYQFRPD